MQVNIPRLRAVLRSAERYADNVARDARDQGLSSELQLTRYALSLTASIRQALSLIDNPNGEHDNDC